MMFFTIHKSQIGTVIGSASFLAAALTFISSGTGVGNPLIIGFIAASLLALSGVFSPLWIVIFSLAVSTLTGGPELPDIPGLPIGAHGFFTSAILFSSIITLIFHWRKVRPSWFIGFLPFLCFLAWICLRIPASSSLSVAVSNSVIFATPILLIPVVMLATQETRLKSLELIFFFSILVPIFILLVGFLTGVAYFIQNGFYSPFGNRTLALYLIPALCFLLSRAHTHPSKKWRVLSIAIAILDMFIVFLSLSRMVAVIILILLLLFFLLLPDSGRSRKRRIIFITMITGFSVLLLVFFLRGMNAWTTAGWNSFDSSNRLTVWPVIIRDSLQNPWVGNGTGSVRSLTWALAKMDHPHNDFLRVFYDQGGIGLILFLSAWLHRILHHLKGVLHYRRIEESASNYRLHLAGFLAATGIFLSFTTDNTLVYAFVLIPAFVLFAMADSSNMNNRIQ